MGWTLRTTVLQLKTHFTPKLPFESELRETEKKLKQCQKKNFDHHHRTKNLKPLKAGQRVWLSDRRESGTVVEKVASRPYVFETVGV